MEVLKNISAILTQIIMMIICDFLMLCPDKKMQKHPIHIENSSNKNKQR